MILIIMSKGSFCDEIKTYADCYNFDVEIVYQNEVDLKEISFSLYQEIFYLGGEVRDTSKMEFFNNTLPTLLVTKIRDFDNIRVFKYLSSLSVFGDVHSDIITLETERQPINIYGITKHKFDQFILNESEMLNGLNVCAILPASINSNRGRSSIEQWQKLSKRYLPRQFGFNGCLSFVMRSDLVSHIFRTDSSKILSSSFSLKKQWNFPRPPLICFKFLSLIDRKISLKARMIFRGIVYK
jgi:hypothetical protein